MADSGARDVVNGVQTATCGALELLEKGPDPVPSVGTVEIVLSGQGSPVCAIETHKTDVRQYAEIDEDFAITEGCSDLKEWQDIHEAYFRRKNCFSNDMKLLQQHFRVLEVFGTDEETTRQESSRQESLSS